MVRGVTIGYNSDQAGLGPARPGPTGRVWVCGNAGYCGPTSIPCAYCELRKRPFTTLERALSRRRRDAAQGGEEGRRPRRSRHPRPLLLPPRDRNHDGRSSPTIGEALWHLEYVLQLHEAYKRSVDCESFGSSELGFADMSFSLPHIREGEEEHNSKPSSLREDTDIS